MKRTKYQKICTALSPMFFVLFYFIGPFTRGQRKPDRRKEIEPRRHRAQILTMSTFGPDSAERKTQETREVRDVIVIRWGAHFLSESGGLRWRELDPCRFRSCHCLIDDASFARGRKRHQFLEPRSRCHKSEDWSHPRGTLLARWTSWTPSCMPALIPPQSWIVRFSRASCLVTNY